MLDTIHEECGIFGIFNCNKKSVAEETYYGLYSLQHRGQESCGIAAAETNNVICYKGMGLVGDVFSQDILNTLKGSTAIGHVRYSTTGGSVYENAQPLVSQYKRGTFAIAHNGNLTNDEQLRAQLEEEGAIFQTYVDSEIFAALIGRYRVQTDSLEDALAKAMLCVKGGYALLVMRPDKIIAARDPFGFKPLCMGKLPEGYVFASESCALDAVGAERIRDIEPGEIIVCDHKGIRSIRAVERKQKGGICIFEYIYFARPDSVMDGVSIYESRLRAGTLLAQQHPVEADIVIGVPESGLDAAAGFSMASGIPLVRGFVKNSYIGRTFIKPDQAMRKEAVAIKLNPIRSVVQGKRIVMIDDSIVRGTTIGRIVKMLRACGAREVHVRISAPPFLFPCYYGTDVPSKDQLIAKQHQVEDIARMICADSLGYLSQSSLSALLSASHRGFCDACFSGEYPDGEKMIMSEE